MKLNPKEIFSVVKEAAGDWSDDFAPRLGAALAYYTIFSLSPLFIIVIWIAGLWFGRDAAQLQILDEVSGMVGQQGSEALKSMIASSANAKEGVFATVMAVVTLVVGATGVFIQLQDALNSIWEVKQKPGMGIKGFIRHRVLSMAMVMGIGFLLLVSLVVTAGLSAVGKYVGGLVPGLEAVWHAVNFVVSFGVITVLFAMIFKIMPDVKLLWRDVWLGAVFTSLLFSVGKLGLGLYLGKSSVTSAYGAAGSLVIILLWVYYSAQILFFGAELTQVLVRRLGHKIEPAHNAMWAPEGMTGSKFAEAKPAQPAAAGAQPALAQGLATAKSSPPAPRGSQKHGGFSPVSSLVLLLFVALPLGKRKLIHKLKH